MKSYHEYDRFERREDTMFLMKRPDPYLPIASDELPNIGDTVEIDGKQMTVANTHVWGDGEFAWWPEISITVKKAC